MRRISTIVCWVALTLIAAPGMSAQTPEPEYPSTENHFDALYSNADGRYVWSEWKGSFHKWQKQFRKDLEKTLGLDRMRLSLIHI